MVWEEVVIWSGRRLLYGLRGLLYAGKPTCRKAAPSKILPCIKASNSKDFRAQKASYLAVGDCLCNLLLFAFLMKLCYKSDSKFYSLF